MAGINQVITALDGELPDLADPENFEAEANEFLTVKLPLLQTQLNVLRGEINTVSSAINAAISGGAFAIDYVFSTTTAAADPGPGYIRLNNATQNASTAMYMDILDVNGANWQAAIDLFDDSTSTIKGYLVIRGRADGTKFLVLALTALATPSGYRSLTATVAAYTSASPFANDEAVTVTFTPKGDKGDIGNTGPAVDIAATIHAAADKPTIADADEFGGSDSAASFGLKKYSWSNIKLAIKAYADTLYLGIGAGSPTFGMPSTPTVVWPSAAGGYFDACVLSSTLSILIFQDGSGYTRALALTISGSTITPGTSVVVEATATSQAMRVVPLTATTALAAWYNTGQGAIRACVLSISGSTVTAGTVMSCSNWGSSGSTTDLDMKQLSATTALLAFAISGNCYAQILSVSGGVVTDNARVNYDTGVGSSSSGVSIAVTSATKFAVGYVRDGSAMLTCGTFSGTTLGTAVTSVSIAGAATGSFRLATVGSNKAMGVFADPTVSLLSVAFIMDTSPAASAYKRGPYCPAPVAGGMHGLYGLPAGTGTAVLGTTGGGFSQLKSQGANVVLGAGLVGDFQISGSQKRIAIGLQTTTDLLQVYADKENSNYVTARLIPLGTVT